MVTVIYTYRDRNPLRLKKSVTSLREVSEIEFEVIVVDYGSRNQEGIKNVCHDLSVRRIRCESEGLPWCRSHAINIGVKNSKTKYVAITDIDMLFESDILKVSIDKSNKKTDIHCRPIWLPENGDKSNAKLGDYSQLGGYQFLEKEAFYLLNGMDERIRFWGNEDQEWAMRLQKNGYKQIWIEDEAKIYHLWHEPSVGIYDARPISAATDTWSFMISSVINQQKENKLWGKNLTNDDRPIMRYCRKKTPKEIDVQHFIHNLPDLVEHFQQETFICLNLGSRFKEESGSGDWVLSLMKILNQKICKRWGFKISKRVNPNFDQWYVSLPYLNEVGLIDYYISRDFDKIYMLFEH